MSENDVGVLLRKIDDGFHGVYLRLEGFQKEFNMHQLACFNRFALIEKEQAVTGAVRGIEEKEHKAERDWGKWFVRLCIGALVIERLTAFFTG